MSGVMLPFLRSTCLPMVMCLAACGPSPDSGQAAEGAVLSAVLRSLVPPGSGPDSLSVHPLARAWALDERTFERLKGEGGPLSPTIVASFSAANADAPSLTPLAIAEAPARFLDPGLAELFERDGALAWPALRRVWGPDAALVYLSQPGFDATGDLAVVYYEVWCGPNECAEGFFAVLRRGATGWAVHSSELVWAT